MQNSKPEELQSAELEGDHKVNTYIRAGPVSLSVNLISLKLISLKEFKIPAASEL